MSNSSSNLDYISQSQASKEVTANAMFDAASPATLWGRRASTTSGLTWGYYGGEMRNSAGVHTLVANGSITLTASTGNYIEADPATGALSKSTTSFTPGLIPVYYVLTGTSTVTSYNDLRITALRMATRMVKAMSDANYTLLHEEARSDILEFTGTLSTTRNVVVPLKPWQWTIYNGTTQSIQIIGATGTGITIASTKCAIVYADGTNIRRVTADA